MFDLIRLWENTLSQHTHTEPFSRSYAHDTQQAAINFIRIQPNPVLNLQRLQRLSLYKQLNFKTH